jgi:hypothetical protein
MKTLHELCESHFYKEIDRKIVGEQRDEVKRQAKEDLGGFWVMKKKLSG